MIKPFYSLSQFFYKLSGISRSSFNSSNYQYLIGSPAWLKLSNASDYRKATQENPVLYGCIDILATAAANGRKYLVDKDGQEVPWDQKGVAIDNARKLFVDGPNPLQSSWEFSYERAYMFYTFGNNYVYLNSPLEAFKGDIIAVQSMFNLPSEYVTIKQTGKLYDQVDIEGIIEKYSLTNYNPPKEFDPGRIIHFNDINVSDVGNSIIGTSRLEVLKKPITNTQLTFEAMNVILKSRGMQGIIKANNKDATGTQIPLNSQAKEEIDETFKREYGVLEDQKQFLISYSDIDFIKTIMSPSELGIYDEFTNNAMVISNGFNIPPELYKTYTKGATFENQQQAVRRLYQNAVIPRMTNDDKYFTDRLGLRNHGLELRTSFDHVEALQEAFKDKAIANRYNGQTAEAAYNNNIITMNQYLDMLGMEPVSGGNVYKKDTIDENAE